MSCDNLKLAAEQLRILTHCTLVHFAMLTLISVHQSTPYVAKPQFIAAASNWRM
jgi:hypothetical protein